MKTRKSVLCIALVLCMLISALPLSAVSASAEEAVTNVIFMIGDGMGAEQIKAGSIAKGANLVFQDFTFKTMVNTSSLSGTTDSAAAATAMATGVKTKNSNIGLDGNGNKVENLVEFSKARGLKTGIVATQVLPHATPAGFTAHVTSRYSYNTIAVQQIMLQPDVLMGGGATYFLNREQLLEENNFVVATTLEDALSAELSKNLLGIFDNNYITADEDPELADMADLTLQRLSNDNGFFAMIEGSDIDSYCHQNDMENMLKEILDFDDAVQVAKDYADSNPGTLLIVTADHETGGLSIPEGTTKEGLTNDLFSSEAHTGVNVPLFAYGTGAEELCSADSIQNTDIYSYIAQELNATYGEAPATDFTNYNDYRVFFEKPDHWEKVTATVCETGTDGFTTHTLDALEDNIYSLTLHQYKSATPGALEITFSDGGKAVILGDADNSESVNVRDATAIQKHVAMLITLSEEGIAAADVNDDDNLNVKDATTIQKHVAGMSTGYPIGTNTSESEDTVFDGFYKLYRPDTDTWEDYAPAQGVIYFEKPASWDESVYMYTSGTCYYGEFPGTQMTAVEGTGNVYSLTVSDDALNEDFLEFTIVFSDGKNKYQTTDINFAGFNKVFRVFGEAESTTAYGCWYDYPYVPKEPSAETVKIYLADETEWNIKQSNAALFVQCDGAEPTALTYEGKDSGNARVWSAEIPANTESLVFLRKNSSSPYELWNVFTPITQRTEGKPLYALTDDAGGYWDAEREITPDEVLEEVNTPVTLYYAVPQAIIDAGYTVKVNRRYDKDAGVQEWAQMNMTDTGNTYNGKKIYTASFTLPYGGIYVLQFQNYQGATWKSQAVAINESWTEAEVINNKLYDGTNFVDYTPGTNVGEASLSPVYFDATPFSWYSGATVTAYDEDMNVLTQNEPLASVAVPAGYTPSGTSASTFYTGYIPSNSKYIQFYRMDGGNIYNYCCTADNIEETIIEIQGDLFILDGVKTSTGYRSGSWANMADMTTPAE